MKTSVRPAAPRMCEYGSKVIRDSAFWTSRFVAVAYLALCAVNGFIWSTELAPTYGLVIIRFIVVAFLAIVSAVILPFQQGGLLAHAIINLVLLVAPVALLGFTLRYAMATKRFGLEPRELTCFETAPFVSIAGYAFLAVVAVTVVMISKEHMNGQGEESMMTFLLGSPGLGVAFLGSAGAWILAGTVAPGRPRHVRLSQALCSADTVLEAMRSASSTEELQAIFDRAFLRTGVLMMLASGNPGEEERQAVKAAFASITGEDVGDKALDTEVEAARATGDDALGYLVGLRNVIGTNAKDLFLKAALSIAVAGGRMETRGALDLLVSMAQAMDVSAERLRTILNNQDRAHQR